MRITRKDPPAEKSRRHRGYGETGTALLCAACLFFMYPAASLAVLGGADKGTSSGQFLKLGAGARAAGMGEAYSSIADDASAIYWNPAALSRISGFSATFMHAALLADISYDFLGFGQRLGRCGALGVGLQYLSMPAFHETDPSGFETGTGFSPGDMGVTLAYSFAAGEKYSAGISGKYIRSEIDRTASTYAADLGMLARFFGGNTRLAFVVQNLGGRMRFGQNPDPLPLNVKLGSSLNIKKNWLVGFDANFPRDNRPYAALGAEYRAGYGADSGFAGRLGYNSRTLGDVNGFSGMSAGAGFNFGQVRLDYAFMPFGAIGMTHRISVTAGFGKSGDPGVSNAVLKADKSAAKIAGHPVASAASLTAAGTKPAGSKVRLWLTQLRSQDWQERRAAAFELGIMKAAEAAGALLELLDDENDEVCGAAALALGQIGNKRDLFPLIERLEDESAYVRASAAGALGYLGDKSAVKALKSALKDDSARVRKAAASALKQLYSK